MSDFPDDIMKTASWVAAHRLDLSTLEGQQIVRLIAHSLNDERRRMASLFAALEEENNRLREALEPFARAPYVGPNAFNRAALSDNDFRAARAALEAKS